MGMTIDGQDMSQITGGAHWVSIPLPDQVELEQPRCGQRRPDRSAEGPGAEGRHRTSLGTKTIDGTTASGYSVTPSHQEIENTIQQEIQQNQMSADHGQQLLQGSNLFGMFTSDVWIDGSGLIREEDANVSGGSAGVNAKVSVELPELRHARHHRHAGTE